MHWLHFKWDVQEKGNEGKKRRRKEVNEKAWHDENGEIRDVRWTSLWYGAWRSNPFYKDFTTFRRARGKGRYRRFPGIQSTFYNKGKELRWSKGREVSQNEIWTAVEIAERKQWQDLLSSKEWRLTERHFNLCESRISAIVTKTLSLYKDKDKEGHLNLNIKEEADIARGIDAYFADLNRFTSNQQRLRHIQRVRECIGNQKSPIWREIRGYMEKKKKDLI